MVERNVLPVLLLATFLLLLGAGTPVWAEEPGVGSTRNPPQQTLAGEGASSCTDTEAPITTEPVISPAAVSEPGSGVPAPVAVTPEALQAVMQELDALRSQVKTMADELKQLRDKQAKVDEAAKDLKEKDMVIERRQAKQFEEFEGVKQPINFSGDFTLWYQNTRLRDNAGGRGNSSSNLNIFRLAGLIPMAPKAFGTYRIMAVQPDLRTGDGKTTFMLDILSLDKGSMFGGDWRFGRQWVRLGNGLLVHNFLDGISYAIKIKPKLGARALYFNEAIDTQAGRTHGLAATAVTVEYRPSASHTIEIARLENKDRSDKYGVTSPGAREFWYSLDLHGQLAKRVSYLGNISQYGNDLDTEKLNYKQQHLRGDVANKAVYLGLDYEEPKKFKAGFLWAENQNNFRSVSTVTALQNRGIPYHPLEDVFMALAMTARNARTGAFEGIFPPNAGSAAPANTPINRVGETAATGFYVSDIHGYSDFQLSGQYWFRPFLSLRVAYDLLRPLGGGLGYRDVKVTSARMLYQICAKSQLEFRAVRLISEYGRAVFDTRSEFFMRF